MARKITIIVLALRGLQYSQATKYGAVTRGFWISGVLLPMGVTLINGFSTSLKNHIDLHSVFESTSYSVRKQLNFSIF